MLTTNKKRFSILFLVILLCFLSCRKKEQNEETIEPISKETNNEKLDISKDTNGKELENISKDTKANIEVKKHPNSKIEIYQERFNNVSHNIHIIIIIADTVYTQIYYIWNLLATTNNNIFRESLANNKVHFYIFHNEEIKELFYTSKENINDYTLKQISQKIAEFQPAKHTTFNQVETCLQKLSSMQLDGRIGIVTDNVEQLKIEEFTNQTLFNRVLVLHGLYNYNYNAIRSGNPSNFNEKKILIKNKLSQFFQMILQN